jgi:hypothetical protein
MRQGSMRFYAAGRCGSNRFNTDINTELKSLQKFLNMIQKVFRRIVVAESSGIDTGYNVGLYGWNGVDTVFISYGPGSKSGCVWL